MAWNYQGRSRICHDFYQDLYKYKEISEEALHEVFEGFPIIVTHAMNVYFFRLIIHVEVFTIVDSMAKEKAPSHDGIPIEIFNNFGQPFGNDFYQMIRKSIKLGAFYEGGGVSKGLIRLIPKKGDDKNLNYWHLITLFAPIHNRFFFAKVLQFRSQPILSDIISPKHIAFRPLRISLDNIVLT